MSKKLAVLLLAVTMAAALACGPLGSLGNMVSGSQAGTAASLWSDVPAYPGADKVDLEMPLVIRLAVEAASKAVMTKAGDAAGNLEFIAYTTGDSPDDVQTFYTNARMVSEGWADREDLGCGMTSVQTQDVGAMCAFYKQGKAQDSALFLVVAPGDNGQSTIFYIRIDANPSAMATGAAQ
jgi:hypothetical protein